MRLFHLGLPVAVVGDMTTPALRRDGVFFASSGPGETSTVLTLMKVAHAARAKNLPVTAQPNSGGAADFRGLWVALVFASFLIGLGGTIVGRPARRWSAR